MKKVVITLFIALAAGLSVWAAKPTKVRNLVNQYRNHEGFEVVSIGRLGTSLLKGVIMVSSDMDEDDRAMLKAFTDIKSLTIVDFEDAHPEVKERFTRKLDRLFDGMELILEANDDGEHVRIYGTDDGNRIKDCILYDCSGALIITEGGIDIDKVAKLMELQK
jgi:hypothetical protein